MAAQEGHRDEGLTAASWHEREDMKGKTWWVSVDLARPEPTVVVIQRDTSYLGPIHTDGPQEPSRDEREVKGTMSLKYASTSARKRMDTLSDVSATQTHDRARRPEDI